MNCLNCKAVWQVKTSMKGIKYYKCDSCAFWCPADRATEQPISRRGSLNGLPFDPAPQLQAAEQQPQTANIPPSMLSGTMSATLIRMMAILTELSGTLISMQKQIAGANGVNTTMSDDAADMPPPAPPVKRQRQD